ncbi:MAG: ATP-binding cassette domain-containing protein [Candidatus Bathyarchaeota archaeon]|nr:ATP-binding cassette domain-containing protein [Candidatus Bathyarchaeota archaeon]
MTEYAVSVEGLNYNYGKLNAVNSISFNIKKGQIFSFLGPNGAGKTTTINLLITLVPIQKGKVTIAGFDVATQKDEVRKSIGVVFQDQRLDRDLTVWETLDFHGRIYSIPKEIRYPRIEELLELVELTEKRNVYTKNLSGGMKRRLEIARGLLVQPKVLFLDEPTIGLDTQTRKRIWSYIKKVNREGVTVFLTTHYMDEADQNSDIICIIDKGKIIANGTPENLKKSLAQDYIHLQTDDDAKTIQLIKDLPDVRQIRNSSKGLIIHLKEGGHLITKLIDLLRTEGVEIVSIALVEPTLDDVFIHYTGRGFGDVSHENNGFTHS